MKEGRLPSLTWRLLYLTNDSSHKSRNFCEEKKRKYQQRVLDVEMGSFTPLVFETNGRMGNVNEQFAKGNVSQLAVTKIDLNGYQGTFRRFKPKIGKIS